MLDLSCEPGWSYVVAAYGLTWLVLGTYAHYLYRRNQAAARRLSTAIAGDVTSSSDPAQPGKSGPDSAMVAAVLVGGFLGAVVGILLRPAIPMVGQLPVGIVLTGGICLAGVDEWALGIARQSFNQVLAAAVLGAAVGGLVKFVVTRQHGAQ